MADAFKKVKAGDKFHFPARFYNALVDVAGAQLAREHDQPGPPPPRRKPSGLVLVRNSSGADVGQFGILGIEGVAITPHDNEAEFITQPVLDCGLPSTSTNRHRFVVTAEPIADDALGLAYISGVCVCHVAIGDAAHKFADIEHQETGYLASGTRGAAQILWSDSAPSSTAVKRRLTLRLVTAR